MKILLAIPGHLKTVPMGAFSHKALRELGQEVILFDYKESLQDKILGGIQSSRGEEKAAVNRRLRRVTEDTHPDLFITLFGFDISIDSLQWLREHGIPTACWWINDPFQLNRSLKKAPFYSMVFSNSAGCLDAYREAGVAEAHFLPTACDPDVHRPLEPNPDWRCDVCFAGDWSPLRQQVMELMLDQGIDIRIFGPWKTKLPANSRLLKHLHNGFFTPNQMAQMFASAKVVFNIHTWFENYDHGTNPRLFEAAGCGRVQLVDWKQEIPELFEIGRELSCYQGIEEIPQRVEQLLALSDEGRAEMGRRARQRALDEHTYRHRMETIIAGLTK